GDWRTRAVSTGSVSTLPSRWRTRGEVFLLRRRGDGERLGRAVVARCDRPLEVSPRRSRRVGPPESVSVRARLGAGTRSTRRCDATSFRAPNRTIAHGRPHARGPLTAAPWVGRTL